jgi:outer membrane protein TolC
MTKKISLTIISVLLLLSNSVEAQKYTLQQCIDIAVNNSYAVRRVRADIKEADYQWQEARSGVLPQVRASGSMDDNVILGKIILPGEIIGQPGTSIPAELGSRYALDFSASLEQVIFSPALFTGIRIAKNNLELQQLRSAMTEEELIFNVSYVYYDILNSMQESEHIAYMLAGQDSLYLLMKWRVEENVTREIDLNRLKVNLTNLHVREMNILTTITQQKRYLQILIGMSVDDEIELDDATVVADVGATLVVAQSPPLQIPQNNIELDILNKQKNMLNLEITQVKAEYLPTLSAVVSGGYQFQAENLRLSKEPWFNSFLVGVRLSVPIFDGFGTRSRIRQKRMQLQRLDADIRETQQNREADSRNALSQLNTAYESLQAQNENLQLAEKVYEQTVLLYKEGLASITDVLETESSLHEAKTARTSEIIRYKKAEVDLLKANGTLNQLRIKN